MQRVFALSTLFILALCVSARSDGPNAAPSKEAAMQKELLRRFDANGDGKLSDAERLRAQEFLKRTGNLTGSGIVPGGFPGADDFAKKFDLDGDGRLSDKEKLAAQSAFQRLRTSGGGPVAGGELGAAPPQPQQTAPLKEKKKKLSGLAKRFDANGDGQLSEDEKAALQAETSKKKTKKSE